MGYVCVDIPIEKGYNVEITIAGLRVMKFGMVVFNASQLRSGCREMQGK